MTLEQLKTSIIAILHPDNTIVGTGFVITENLAVTCSHVVDAAKGAVGQTVIIRFYASKTDQIATVLSQGWSSANDDDIAFLELSTPPDVIQPVMLSLAQDSEGHSYLTFGFAKIASYSELIATGTINGIVQSPGKLSMLQLKGDEVAKGLSGAPVLNSTTGYVIGMISEFKDTTHTRIAWATTVETIARQLSQKRSSGTLAQYEIPFIYHSKSPSLRSRRELWGFAPDPIDFFGRDSEIDILTRWSLTERCRLVGIFGLGGMGKTTLAARFSRWQREQFDFVIWRSLATSVQADTVIAELLAFMSSDRLPDDSGERLSALIEHCRNKRCLIILDNLDTVIQAENTIVEHRSGYTSYNQLIRIFGETDHMSCLFITSREKSNEFALLESDIGRVRSLYLHGLTISDAKQLLQGRNLIGEENDWERLVYNYSGNPMALRLASNHIVEVFFSNIGSFLQNGDIVTQDIENLLDQHTQKLSHLELRIVCWLAIKQEVATLANLREVITDLIENREIQQAISLLNRRSIVERRGDGFTMPTVVMEYVTRQIVRQSVKEICSGDLKLLCEHALLEAQANDYIRAGQRELILKPIAHRLIAILGNHKLVATLKKLLSVLRRDAAMRVSYAGGNILNLLNCAFANANGYNFSRLAIWQADLQGLELHDVNFNQTDLTGSTFTEIVRTILSLSFSTDGTLLAAGDSTGEITIWRTKDMQRCAVYSKHVSSVWSIVFSPDGQSMASCSHDQTIRFWNLTSGQNTAVFLGHTSWVAVIVYHPNGRYLISGGGDGAIRIWDTTTGQCLATMLGNDGFLHAIAISDDGRILATGGSDQIIRIWDLQDLEHPQLVGVLHGHSSSIYTLAFNRNADVLVSGGQDGVLRLWYAPFTITDVKPIEVHRYSDQIATAKFGTDGRTLAVASHDGTATVWDVGDTGRLRHLLTLQGHKSAINGLAMHPTKPFLATGGRDSSICLWDIEAGHRLRSVQGYNGWLNTVSFVPLSDLLVSAGNDCLIRLWDIKTVKCIATLRGHTDRIISVSVNPNGNIIASASDDKTIRLWNVETQQLIRVIEGHASRVRFVTFSPDGQSFASIGMDGTLRLWDTFTSKSIVMFHEAFDRVSALAFSPDGRHIAASLNDFTIRIWDLSTRVVTNTLYGHSKWVQSLAYSPDGSTLASGDGDGIIRLWNIGTGQTVKILKGHERWITSVVFNLEGRELVSGSGDRTVRIWNVEEGIPRLVLAEHNHWVHSIAVSADAQTIASTGADETIRLWDTNTGTNIVVLSNPKPYMGMKITKTIGLTDAQRQTLFLLGATE